MPTPFRALLVAVVLGALLGIGAPGAAVTAAPRVTLVADSVGGVLFWQRQARDELARGIDLRIDIRTCRRLVTEGCVYDGERPPSALDAIKDLGPALGKVAVVDVGYNDPPGGFGAGVDRVMRALLDAGVDRVIWITLRELRPELGGDQRPDPRGAEALAPADGRRVGARESRARRLVRGRDPHELGGRRGIRALPPTAGPRCVRGDVAEDGEMLTVGGPLRWARACVRFWSIGSG